MEYDALIVGARAAGASLALLLARQGRRVLMVDRDTFPSDTLSTHLLSFMAVDSLRRLGVLEDVEAAGFRRLTRTRTWVEDVCLDAPAGPAGAYALAPRRSVLDSVLIDHAVAAGAEFWERTRAEALVHDGGRVAGATLRRAAGEVSEVRARVLVGADGKYSKVADLVGARKYNETPALRPVYYAYLNGVEPGPQSAMEIWFGRDRIGFRFPMRPGEDLLALEIQPGEFESFRADPEAAFWQGLRELPTLAGQVAGARLEGKIQGTRGVDNFYRTPFGPGWALTGDAGLLKDPCTGLGVGDAILQSVLLARELGRWFDGAGWETSMDAYHSGRDTLLGMSFQHTVDAARLADREGGPHRLDALRALGVNPHLGRVVLEGLPGLLDQALDPLQVAITELVQRRYAAAEAPAT